MEVRTSHHVDASERDQNGAYDYYYEYDLFQFADSTSCLLARSYVYEPNEAHFLRTEIDNRPRLLTEEDLGTALFFAAVAHLRGLGKSQINWLSGRGDGYEAL